MKKSEARQDMAHMDEVYADLMAKSGRAPARSTPGLIGHIRRHVKPKRRVKMDELSAKRLISRIRQSDINLHPWLKLMSVLGMAFAFILLIWLGVKILGGRSQANNTSGSIAPSSVYVPKGLPEGFSVGSGSQNLENGAVLYTVYSDQGHEITVTQQALPENFDVSLLQNAQNFDTELGSGYIIEASDRMTGYILTDKTMLLFNSTNPIESDRLRGLMESFRP